MNILTILRTALKSIKHHKVRSTLTTLGIIIGVVSIICVMSIGEGAKHKVNEEIKKLGSNFIIVLSASQKKLNRRGQSPIPLLTPKDLRILKTQCDDINQISAGTQLRGSALVSFEGTNVEPIITGVEDNYLGIREWKLIFGDFITKEDSRRRTKVAVIGKTVFKDLFNSENPIGKNIRIRKNTFKVIGVLDEMGKRPDGTDQDDIIMIPLSTLLKKIQGGRERYFVFIISAKSKDRIPQAVEEIRSILRQTHAIKENGDEDFTIFSQDDISQASDAATKILNLLLLFIASISLIVGGIGIMNIMLVTVSERTKEIGIRMALGATTGSILMQFIIEAVTICLIGGIGGTLIGVSIALIIGLALGWPMAVSSSSVVLSLSSSALIGLFFGYYPARKASMLNPVEALLER